MRTYVLTDRELSEIRLYLSGDIGKTPYLRLILSRAQESLPTIKGHVELLEKLLKDSSESQQSAPTANEVKKDE